jgi:hypothetical protein
MKDCGCRKTRRRRASMRGGFDQTKPEAGSRSDRGGVYRAATDVLCTLPVHGARLRAGLTEGFSVMYLSLAVFFGPCA